VTHGSVLKFTAAAFENLGKLVAARQGTGWTAGPIQSFVDASERVG
jgi:hypothetical protein